MPSYLILMQKYGGKRKVYPVCENIHGRVYIRLEHQIVFTSL